MAMGTLLWQMRALAVCVYLLMLNLPQHTSIVDALRPESKASTSDRVNIIFGSCNDVTRLSLWGKMLDSEPDHLVLLGDNVYADTKVGAGPGGTDLVFGTKFIPADEEAFIKQYGLMKTDPDFQALVDHLGGWGSKNILATFDDHDYGVNNGDRSYVGRNVSQKAFWDFTEVPEDSPLRRQEGVYNSHTYRRESMSGGSEPFIYKVIMLDTRSNKGEYSSPSVENKQNSYAKNSGDFLGEEQWAWLEQQMADPEPDLILLGSSIQVLPTDKVLEETWDEFPAARQRLLSLVQHTRKVYTPNVFVLSGDIHTAEVLQAEWTCGSGATAATAAAIAAATDTNATGHRSSRDTGTCEDSGGGICGEDLTTYEKRAAQRLASKHLSRMWEFTSSGISHTFTKTTRKKREMNSGGGVIDVNVSTQKEEGIEQSRGIAYELLYDMYVAISVSHYRQHRFGHHYRGLHYAKLTISFDHEHGLVDDENEVLSGYKLRVDTLDQHNKAVITTEHSLVHKRALALAAGSHEQLELLAETDYMLSGLGCRTIPFHGIAPAWRVQLARYSHLGVPFFFAFIPAVIVLTLLVILVSGLIEALWDLVRPLVPSAEKEQEQEQEQAKVVKATRASSRLAAKN